VHIYPSLLLSAKNRGGAIEAAGFWVSQSCQGGNCPYDYGNVVAIPGEYRKGAILQGGTKAFRQAVESSLKTERRVLKEHWDVAKQFLTTFQKPPSDGVKFSVVYNLGIGITHIVKAGKRVKTEYPAHMGYHAMRKLEELKRHTECRVYAISTGAVLYDIREDKKIPPAKAGKDCWLVLLRFHV